MGEGGQTGYNLEMAEGTRDMGQGTREAYLEPYRKAAAREGDLFGALLWASPRTQAARFEAICSLAPMTGKRVLDVGCGRADLVDFFGEREIGPAEYVGIEAVVELVGAAMWKESKWGRIVQGDFVREPGVMLVGADVVVFSGSLNTLDVGQFEKSLREGFEAAGEVLVFNFLAAAHIANAEWLRWHRKEHVMGMVSRWGKRAAMRDDYLDGDCTIAVYKS
jgi:hypothetical protein